MKRVVRVCRVLYRSIQVLVDLPPEATRDEITTAADMLTETGGYSYWDDWAESQISDYAIWPRPEGDEPMAARQKAYLD